MVMVLLVEFVPQVQSTLSDSVELVVTVTGGEMTERESARSGIAAAGVRNPPQRHFVLSITSTQRLNAARYYSAA